DVYALFSTNQAMARAGLPTVSPHQLTQPAPSLPPLSPLLQLQLSPSPPPRLPRPRHTCQPPLLRRDGFYDNTRSICKVALCVKADDRTAPADSARIPCPS